MSKVTVWYDGACPLCIREIALLERLDKNSAIEFLDLTLPGTTCPLDRNVMLQRFHVLENNHLYSGAAAFAATWRAIPMLRPLGIAARIPFILSLLEHGYRLFLNFRPRLQRLTGGKIKT